MENIILSSGTVVTPEDIRKIASVVNEQILTTSKDPGQYEEANSLQGISSLPVFRRSGTAYELVRVAVTLLKGADGKQIVLQVTPTHIQWRYTGGQWQDLMPIADLQKPAKDMIDKVAAALKQANTAINTANTANTEAGKALTTATEASNKANAATTNANSAAKKANDAAGRVDESIKLAQTATANANEATNEATESAKLAQEKAGAADRAASSVTEVITKADTATNDANEGAAKAKLAAVDANEAVQLINAALAEMEELEQTITAKDRKQPKSMTVEYPRLITSGNTSGARIVATLYPAGTGSNVLFLSDNRAVTATPSGDLIVNGAGKSIIHVIPTENTSIYETIEIEVIPVAIRLNTNSSLRFTSSGAFRFM